GGLEGNHHALALGGFEDLVAVHGQQRLVGGDHVLAVGNRVHHQFARDAVAADQLDDDIHFGVGDHREGVIGNAHALTRDTASMFEVLVGDDADAGGAAGATGDLLLVALEHVEGATADGADAEKAYIDWFHVLPERFGKDCVTQERSGGVTAAVLIEEARDATDGVLQVVLVRQEDQPEVVGIAPVEARTLHQQHALLLEQFENEVLVVLDRVELGVKPRKQVQGRTGLDAGDAGNGREQVV